jgi:hypothetical protein
MLSNTVKRNLLILLGTMTWSITTIKSGLLYGFGIGYWGPQGHDGVWHLSLINSLASGNFHMPLFAGESIKNYHLGFDLFVAILHRITFIPVSLLYFQILPPLFAMFIGYLVYKLVFNWTNSNKAGLWSTFFVYFGSSFGWLISFFRDGSLGGESLFWSQQAISTLINPPLALSFCLLLLGLWLLQTRRLVLAGLVFAIIPSIKIYGGILGFVGLFFICLKDKQYWKTFIISALLGSVLFFPLNSGSAKLLVWDPLWFLKNLMNVDHLNWPRYFSALDTYSTGHVWYKAIPAYAVAFIIFLVGNLSIRLLSLFSLEHPKKFTWWKTFLVATAIVGIFPPMLFLQQGTAWNTIQFFYYTQFFLAILAGIGVSHLKPNLIFSLIIILLTIPGTIGTLPHYLPSRPPAKISTEELSSLNYLYAQPNGTVLTYPFDPDAASAAIAYPPRPLYLYESTSYVSAYTSKPVFMEDQVNLNITGYDWKSRREQSLKFFTKPYRKFLVENNIKYIYLVGFQRQSLENNISSLKKIFSNSEVNIYRVE